MVILGSLEVQGDAAPNVSLVNFQMPFFREQLEPKEPSKLEPETWSQEPESAKTLLQIFL